MEKEKRPSEVIQDFLDLIDKSHAEYESAQNKVAYFDSKTFTWTHELEDAPNKAERNKLATAWQKELRQRRIEKDRMKLWEKIHEIGADVSNKAYIKRLRHLVEAQRKSEDYVNTPYEKREYKGRVVRKIDSNRG